VGVIACGTALFLAKMLDVTARRRGRSSCAGLCSSYLGVWSQTTKRAYERDRAAADVASRCGNLLRERRARSNNENAEARHPHLLMCPGAPEIPILKLSNIVTLGVQERLKLPATLSIQTPFVRIQTENEFAGGLRSGTREGGELGGLVELTRRRIVHAHFAQYWRPVCRADSLTVVARRGSGNLPPNPVGRARRSSFG
jgi:hypothetical protein